MGTLARRLSVSHGVVFGTVDEPVGAATAGIVDAGEAGSSVPAMGDTFAVGTAGAELTPRFPIS
jgi:hypothetical protein